MLSSQGAKFLCQCLVSWARMLVVAAAKEVHVNHKELGKRFWEESLGRPCLLG